MTSCALLDRVEHSTVAAIPQARLEEERRLLRRLPSLRPLGSHRRRGGQECDSHHPPPTYRDEQSVRRGVTPATAVWQRANLPEPAPDAVVCHNDLCVENVGTRDGRAVAFIDFDFAAPTDPLVDIAIAARHWVPVRDPHDMNDGRSGVDQIRRFAPVLRRSRPATRSTVVDECLAFLDRALVSMKTRADAGQPLYGAE